MMVVKDKDGKNVLVFGFILDSEESICWFVCSLKCLKDGWLCDFIFSSKEF